MSKQGQSDMTVFKEQDYSIFLDWWFKLARNALHNKCYFDKIIYIDTNAGCGFNYEYDVEGSPIIFCEKAENYNIPYIAHLIDNDKERISELKYRTMGYNVVLHHGDNQEVVKTILDNLPYAHDKSSLGLLYNDENGIPKWDLVEHCSNHLKAQKIDILVRYNTRAVIRNHHHGYHLGKDLPRMVKEYRFVKEYYPFDDKRWSFIFGINHPFNDYRKHGWYRTDTPKGEDLLMRIMYTKDEYKLLNQSSFFDIME